MEADQRSIFLYEGEVSSDTFSLTELTRVVSIHLASLCKLAKLGEGTWHKVYDIVLEGNQPSGMVVRVASPAFPRDKIESEIATMRYIAEHTLVPVPAIYAWNSDASNPVGAEYMIMQKLIGCPALDIWDSLPLPAKEAMVAQVALHLMSIFELRFASAGSLYLSSDGQYTVGPIVSPKYYQAMEGQPVYTDTRVYHELQTFRGPFSSASDWLSSFMRAEIFAFSSTPSPSRPRPGSLLPRDPSMALKIMNEAVRLCSEYPGNNPIVSTMTNSQQKPFSFMFDDFSLSNIMLDNTGQVTGYIDFEDSSIVPIWKCATLPEWLQANGHDDGWSEHGGSEAEKQVLRDAFLREIEHHGMGAEWREAYEKGLPFRKFSWKLGADACFWEHEDDWVKERFAWAAEHPGLGCPEPEVDGSESEEGSTEPEEDNTEPEEDSTEPEEDGAELEESGSEPKEDGMGPDED